MHSPTPSRHPADRRLAGIALRAGGATGFAVMAVAIKLCADRGFSLVEIVFARNAFSVPVILGWLLAGPGLRAVRTRRPMAHLTRSAIGLGTMALSFMALILLPLADATTIGFSAPLFATILSAILLRETIGRHRWLAVAVGFAGVIVVMRPGGSPLAPLGLVVAILSALGTAAANITLRQIGATEGVAATVFWFNTACLAVATALMPFFATPHAWGTWAIASLIGLTGGAAQLCLTGSLRLAPVSVVAPFDYIQLLWAILLGWAIWATHPSLPVVAGAALIMASGLYTVYREHRLHRERLPATPTDL